MIVSGYTLDLYCDGAKDCKNRNARYDGSHNDRGHPPARYSDENKYICWRAARIDGWKLIRKTGLAICPKCVKNGYDKRNIT